MIKISMKYAFYDFESRYVGFIRPNVFACGSCNFDLKAGLLSRGQFSLVSSDSPKKKIMDLCFFIGLA